MCSADLSRYYTWQEMGVDAVLPPPEMQYTDFAQTQRQIMSSPEGDRLLEYWERQLCGV